MGCFDTSRSTVSDQLYIVGARHASPVIAACVEPRSRRFLALYKCLPGLFADP